MSMHEIKLEIRERISKTNQTFITKLGNETIVGISGNDIDKLKIILKKVTRSFKIFRFGAIFFVTILIVFSMLKYFDYIGNWNMNKSGLYILFTLVFLVNAFQTYFVKINLENKIWLLELLNRIEKE